MFGDTEKELIKRLKQGDPGAFVSFVDLFGPVVLRLTRRYANGCEADAEDLTQEIFVALCRSISNFRGDAKLSTFVYRVAINHCLKFAEHRVRRGETVPFDDFTATTGPEQDPQARAAHGELRGKIDDALATLSDGHREVVILHEMHGLTYSECAYALGIPVGTVKSRLFHAFGRLRTQLVSYIRPEEDVAAAKATTLRSSERRGENAAPVAATSIGKLP